MSAANSTTTRAAAVRGILPFVLATAFAFATLPLPPNTDTEHGIEAAIAGAIAALSLGLGYLARLHGVGPWQRAIPPYLFLVAVALLRHAEGGATSGFGILVLLTLTSLAMNAGRRQLIVGLVLICVMFAVPILAFGEPAYPAAEWRRLLLWLVVGGLTARTMQDLVTRVRAESARNDQLSRVDPLTGVSNRRELFATLQREIARARRSDRALTVAMIDMDHFKRYNDQRGHSAGDALLRDTAAAWRADLRAGDTLARYGGEEFTVVLPESDGARAEHAAERLRGLVADGQTCSIGLTELRPDDDAETILARADAALYAAKAAGRDRVASDFGDGRARPSEAVSRT